MAGAARQLLERLGYGTDDIGGGPFAGRRYVVSGLGEVLGRCGEVRGVHGGRRRLGGSLASAICVARRPWSAEDDTSCRGLVECREGVGEGLARPGMPTMGMGMMG